MEPIQPTDRTTVRRLPARGSHDRDLIDSILDESMTCHVGFVVDGRPFVIPTLHVRLGDRLYIHGSAASRMLRAMAGGAEVCVTVTLVDGLVLARSAFHHSMNYRSAMIFGVATPVEDPDEKTRVLPRPVGAPGPWPWQDVRGPSPIELKATAILSLPIVEASAKVRTRPTHRRRGGPRDPVLGGRAPDVNGSRRAGPAPPAAPGSSARVCPLLSGPEPAIDHRGGAGRVPFTG